ncbi:MAG: 16S rRNA (uracil(1498)-N(3))-methyltransferase [Desulfobacteraceae bacterium]|nr:16S rRNA (uracil(1498)-N(3))-methyltransferase [Desulfobacteraceae bacterium]
MNLILLHKRDFVSNQKVVLKDRRFDYIRDVHKAKTGDTLLCGLINSKIGNGKITKFSSRHIEMDVCLENDPIDPLPLILVLALPRPKMLKRIIESVVSLGVKDIYLINSWRVEKSFWQSPLLKDQNLEKYIYLGLEQSKDTVLPKIHQKRFFSSFVKEELALIAKDSLKFTAHPKTDKLCPAGLNEKITLVVGPEGGFIDLEIETLEEIGFNTISFGKRILKVETAVTYLIARIFSK